MTYDATRNHPRLRSYFHTPRVQGFIHTFIVAGLTAVSAHAQAPEVQVPAAQAQTAETPAAVAPAVTSQLLLSTRTHRDGVPIVYPSGTPLITARITTIPPGATIPRHRHPVPLFTYMLEGELSLIDDDGSVHRFKQGQAFIEAAGWHSGKNEGSIPVRLLAVYPGEVGALLSVTPSQ